MSISKTTKKRIFDIIQIGQVEDLPSRMFDILIVICIFVNISMLFLETFDSLSQYHTVFRAAESLTLLVFCVEYALRIWTAPFLYPHQSAPRAVVSFLFSFDGIVDLLTILPFFFLEGFVALRFLRAARILHLFRINNVYDSFHVITKVIYEKRNQLLSSVFIIIVLILGASLCMYHAEHEAQPQAFKNALSGIWYSVATVFTVGYGDIYPITAAGRLMAAVITFLGVGVVAIPTGIISAGFVEQYTRLQGGDRDIHTASLLITKKHKFKDVTADELPFRVLAIIRDGEPVIPLPTTRIRENDLLLYTE